MLLGTAALDIADGAANLTAPVSSGTSPLYADLGAVLLGGSSLAHAGSFATTSTFSLNATTSQLCSTPSWSVQFNVTLAFPPETTFQLGPWGNGFTVSFVNISAFTQSASAASLYTGADGLQSSYDALSVQFPAARSPPLPPAPSPPLPLPHPCT